jgi:c-di-GMP-binding flagellar brake protein YcgR
MVDEKRRFRRLALTMEDGFFGTFQVTDKETLVVPILSLSAGGLHFALPAAKKDLIEKGTRMHLKKLIGTVKLNFLSDISIDVRWKEKANIPDYMFVGCKLLDLSESVQEQVIKFVDKERKTRGQYG